MIWFIIVLIFILIFLLVSKSKKNKTYDSDQVDIVKTRDKPLKVEESKKEIPIPIQKSTEKENQLRPTPIKERGKNESDHDLRKMTCIWQMPNECSVCYRCHGMLSPEEVRLAIYHTPKASNPMSYVKAMVFTCKTAMYATMKR